MYLENKLGKDTKKKITLYICYIYIYYLQRCSYLRKKYDIF